MADYTANAYGINDSRKDGKDQTTTAKKEPKTNFNKGRNVMRFVVAEGDEIAGGEIFVKKAQTVSASDTFTITVQSG